MLAGAINSCHVWEEDQGQISTDFRNGAYEPMLNRIAPRLLSRWQLLQQPDNGAQDK